ncbi:receptor-type tyrosine-protein phosphatase C isoform X2 [Scophthalmus maximus]|uniref:receptor-type tyrosine-protein phosphatase C isoform X2 n=1 Tax=Scophthalmus maximus TaxID=52904 RepID=UPI001FA8928A|nr:receptor-type tyrosine-protein phosphatase C isoform X2 [Scophthalmus maximus]
MAGLCGLKILLLWAGIFGLDKCDTQNVNDTSANSPPPDTTTHSSDSSSVSSLPASTQASNIAMTSNSLSSAHKPAPTRPTPASVSSNQTDNSTPMTATTPTTPTISPTVTLLINTTANTSQVPHSDPPLQCTYVVNPINGGIQVNITSSAVNSVDVIIRYNEEGQPEIKERTVHSNQSSSHEIKQLKPLTVYEHSVTFVDTVGKDTRCNITQNNTMTIKISDADIRLIDCSSKHVCFQTEWDISSLETTQKKTPDGKCGSFKQDTFFCIKPGYESICSDFTTTIRSGSFSANYTKNIPLGFLNPDEINPTLTKSLPPKIETNLPSNCKNLTVDYTCHEPGQVNGSKKLSELEPFTDYSCIGQIMDTDGTIREKTNSLHVKIDCDLTISFRRNIATNTSIELTWNTISQNCGDVDRDLRKLSYECRLIQPSAMYKEITATKETSGKCDFSGLKPYTDYTFEVLPMYNNKKVSFPTSPETLKTDVGVPESITKLKLAVSEHNVIRINCVHSNFNGPHGEYIAQLSYGSYNPAKFRSQTCEFEIKNLQYSTNYTVQMTARNEKFESNPQTGHISTRYNDKAVIGFLVFLIILTSVALFLVIYKIYALKRRKSHDMNENMMLISTAHDEENLMRVEPIAAEVLLESYKRKLADEGRLFLAEFQSIPRIFSRHLVKEAKNPCNVPKNRYVDILPYDYNRVQLTTGNGKAGCDYINASFIDGYKEAKKYIAAQGPKDETVSDFWRMVWEQQSSIIVMVTRCEEGNRAKCAQYWPSPERETEIFEEFIVKLNSEGHFPDYTIRHLSLTNREKSSNREVTHIQFMSWPDHGVPGEAHLLLKLRRRVNAFKNFFSGPIVIHCSAGVGRTGTYIGIDAMMEGLEAEGRVDVYGYVVQLRRQRCLMVQVEAQYILIHQALVEHNQFGETEVALSELHSTLSTLKEKSPDSECTLMEDEFERLPTYRNWRQFNTGLTEENKEKNRSSSVIPYDYNRVLLRLDEGCDSDADEEDEEESSDEEDEESAIYINASHINGYWGPRALIAAQTPLPTTMGDFWLMVYQKRASTIVMLSDGSEGDKESDSVYWDQDMKTFGDFEVEVASTDITPTFVSRNMLIRHVKRKESRRVQHFQFLKWVNGELPETPQDLTDMIKEIKGSGGSGKSQTIVVHCNDGSSRTGLFCALWNVLDSAKTEKLVDVFQVVKTVRKERQNVLSSLEQYQFLYDTVDGAFPVQNGEVKAVQASAADSLDIVNETKAAERPGATGSSDQQGAAEGSRVAADGAQKEEAEKESSRPTQSMEDTSINGPSVPLEV